MRHHNNRQKWHRTNLKKITSATGWSSTPKSLRWAICALGKRLLPRVDAGIGGFSGSDLRPLAIFFSALFASRVVKLAATGNAVSMKPSRFTGVLDPLPELMPFLVTPEILSARSTMGKGRVTYIVLDGK
jgi:hypothetical protein